MEDFVKFLEAKGLNEKVIQYGIEQGAPDDLRDSLKKDCPKEMWLSGSFGWKHTPEGHTYWRGISEEWEQFCVDMNNEAEKEASYSN